MLVLCSFLKVLMASDKMIHRASRTHRTLWTKPVRGNLNFHYLPKLYIGFINCSCSVQASIDIDEITFFHTVSYIPSHAWTDCLAFLSRSFSTHRRNVPSVPQYQHFMPQPQPGVPPQQLPPLQQPHPPHHHPQQQPPPHTHQTSPPQQVSPYGYAQLERGSRTHSCHRCNHLRPRRHHHHCQHHHFLPNLRYQRRLRLLRHWEQWMGWMSSQMCPYLGL